MVGHSENTYNLHLSPQANSSPYASLSEDLSTVDRTKVRRLAQVLLEQLGAPTLSITKWKKRKRFRLSWHEPPPRSRIGQSVELSFGEFVDHLIENRRLDHQALRLPPPEESKPNWMDSELTLWGFYAPCNEADESLAIGLPLTFGSSFPVTPVLDREGFATPSPQLHLQRALLSARWKIISNSHDFVPQRFDRSRGEIAQFQMSGTPPLINIMEYLNLTVSIVDITLIQSYYAATYLGEKVGLKNDDATMLALGPVTGRRMSDKLRWPRIVSGKDLDARDECLVFNELRAARNHFAHFDPPCIAVSIEDVARWLSGASAVAWLLIKIRRCLGLPVSGPLVELAVAPPVEAVPRDPAQPRYPQKNKGYASSTWGGPNPHRGQDRLRLPSDSAEDIVSVKGLMQSKGVDCDVVDLVRAAIRHGLSHLGSMDKASLQREFCKNEVGKVKGK